MWLISKVLIFLCIFSIHPALNAQAIPDPLDELDLNVDFSIENTEVKLGDVINYTVSIANLSTSLVATNVTLKLSYLPDSQISLPELPATICEDDNDVITCTISELTPTASIEITVSAKADTDKRSLRLLGLVEADQPHNNNYFRSLISVEHPPEPEPPELPGTVDLGIEVTQLRKTESGILYDVRVFNQHTENVATDPIVNIHLLEQEILASIDSCAVDEQILRCALPEIAPDADYTFEFTLNTSSDTMRLFIDVSSAQPDRNTLNNLYRSTLITTSGIAPSVEIINIADSNGNFQQQEPSVQIDNVPESLNPVTNNTIESQNPVANSTVESQNSVANNTEELQNPLNAAEPQNSVPDNATEPQKSVVDNTIESQNSVARNTQIASGSGTLNYQLIFFLVLLITRSKFKNCGGRVSLSTS